MFCRTANEVLIDVAEDIGCGCGCGTFIENACFALPIHTCARVIVIVQNGS